VRRQVLWHRHTGQHVLPANAVLPPHGQIVITRGLQERACLWAQDLPFATVARLLGWQTQETQVLCTSTVRTLVRTHGQTIRRSEEAETQTLLAQPEGSTVSRLAPRTQPRRRTGWPAEFSQAVDLALAAGESRPQQGVSDRDWARVLSARRQDATRTLEALRHLGPELEENQVLLTIDEVLTPQTEAKQ